MIETLKKDSRVSYVEPNGLIHEDVESTPIGITQGLGGRSPLSFSTGSGVVADCSDPSAFKVAVVDSGLDASHYDFQYCGINDENGVPDPYRETRCMGKAFLNSEDLAQGQDWYNSDRAHGTHVAGIIAASGLNDNGVTGMIADENICLVISRVFSNDGGATIKNVADGIIWAANVGAKVINMSLGTPSYFQTIANALSYAMSQGMYCENIGLMADTIYMI
jgi:serine protease